ncbi:MAG: hypothetical protein J5938_05440 [Clostridia bacterium]|nr:hypothetical protein [Clostridia bacterium]
MADKEKVMLGLAHCIMVQKHLNACNGCVYRGKIAPPCQAALMEDAAELLIEQDPQVLTWEEVNESENSSLWAEIYSPSTRKIALIYCTVKQCKDYPDCYLLEEETGTGWFRDAEYYNKDSFQTLHTGWRCWSAFPDKEKRKAVKWGE